MIENEMESKDGVAGDDIEARRARFEHERMTRRGALRKFGFMAGMAVFATLSVDDLARIAAKKLQDAEATKGIGDTLAKEFRSAGVVLANDDPGDPTYGLGGTGNYYYAATTPCNQRPDCNKCCETQEKVRDMICFSKHSPNGEHGTYPTPLGTSPALGICLADSDIAASQCAATC